MTSLDNNPIGFILEICQKYGFGYPEYEEIKVVGPDHSREFTYSCKFEGFETLGTSRQKKQAKSEAAKAMATLLKADGFFDRLKTKSGLKKTLNLESEPSNETKNPISVLNEFCQKSFLGPPKFVETSLAGSFYCECVLKNDKSYGNGTNKKSAKTEAAAKMCLKLNLKCNGIEYLRNEEPSERNPVSALQELCNHSYSSTAPLYTELPQVMNLFVVKCTLGTISCEGKGSNKKHAKSQAASLVLARLSAEKEKGPDTNGSATASPLQRILKPTTWSPPKVELQDFNIDSEEENEDNNKSDSLKAENVDLNTKLESLSLGGLKVNDVSGKESLTEKDSSKTEHLDMSEKLNLKPDSEFAVPSDMESIEENVQVKEEPVEAVIV